MNTFLVILHVIVCVLIIFIVLLQVGRGAELGAAFGSMGQANASRGTATFMGKFTALMAGTFMLTSFLLTYNTSSNAKSSVLERISENEIQQQVQPDEAKPAPAAQKATEAPQANGK